jgi:outer membrane lipoprotein-sorting protein
LKALPKKLVVALLLLPVLFSCHPRLAQVSRPDELSQIFSKILNYDKAVSALAASAEIRGRGLLGQTFREEIDVAVKDPSSFYWSLRSFFGPPSFIMAFNGEVLTLWDFSQESLNRYQKLALTANTVLTIFDMEISPQVLIDLLLAKLRIKESHDIQFFKNGDLVTVKLQDGLWQKEFHFDLIRNRLEKAKIFAPSINLYYSVRFLDHEIYEGISFPKKRIVYARGSRKFSFELAFKSYSLNNAAILPDAFFIESH